MSIDHRALDTTIRRSRSSYDSALAKLEQDTIRSVDYDMRGQAFARVRAVLVARFKARLPGVELDDSNLDKIALAISQGRMPG